jgi:hypothetical protein
MVIEFISVQQEIIFLTVQNLLFLKGMMGELAPLSYLVTYNDFTYNAILITFNMGVITYNDNTYNKNRFNITCLLVYLLLQVKSFISKISYKQSRYKYCRSALNKSCF